MDFWNGRNLLSILRALLGANASLYLLWLLSASGDIISAISSLLKIYRDLDATVQGLYLSPLCQEGGKVCKEAAFVTPITLFGNIKITVQESFILAYSEP